MAIRTYHDFVIFTDDVTKDEDGKVRSFSVRVFSSPVGEGEKKDSVTIPADIDLDEWSRQLAERRLDEDVEQQMEFGTRLADMMLPRPYARELYQRSLAWLHEDEGLRLRLRLANELATLPWEYMHIQETSGERTPSGFVALDPRISIVRHEAIAIPAEWFGPAEKRRVLVVMATPEPYADYPQLSNLPAEQELIRQALSQVRGIDVEFQPPYEGLGAGHIPSATVDDVRTALLKSADVFHFSGHGEFVEGLGPGFLTSEGEGAIILADEHNRARSLPGDRLAEMIRSRGVRLVILGCCEGARRDVSHKWSSIAASLLKGEIPSVVTMQFTIQDDLAVAFMGAFYQALVAGQTMDEAVALGRGAVRDKALGERTHVRDWGAPVLYLRAPGGRIFNPVTDREASQEAERKSNQRFRLHQAWWEWMAHGVLPSADQLQHLAGASESLELSPTQALLLLRSAVALDVSVAPWLDRLRLEGGGLIEKLDDPQAPDPASVAEARQMLQLDGDSLSDRPKPIGPVAWSAVDHNHGVTRQTAALALTALQPVPQEGLNRLKQALSEWGGHRRRWWRQAELHGTLADADPEIEKLNTEQLSVADRGAIWLWRVRRRVLRDRQRIGWLTAGGAIGAGLLLGLLRAVTAYLTHMTVGLHFSMNLFWGALLGAALTGGMVIAECLLLDKARETSGTSSIRQGLLRPDRLLAVGLGTFLFGVAHLLVALSTGHLSFSGKSLVTTTGLVAGLGLSLALLVVPWGRRRLGAGLWAVRLGIAAVTFVLIQWVFISTGDCQRSMAIVWPGGTYAADLQWVLRLQQSVERCPLWANYVALVDAALVGVLLATGMCIGLLQADELLGKWRNLVQQVGGRT